MNMKKYLLLFAMVLIALASCDDNKNKVPRLGKAQSAPFELLLVTNKEWLNTQAGQALKVVLNSPIVGLPQQEPHFRLTTINHNAFDGVFRFYANVLVVKVGADCKEPKVSVQKEAYCQNQLLIKMEAPDDASFVTMLREKAEIILDYFDEQEVMREYGLLKKNYSGKVMAQAQKQFGVSIKAPVDIDDIKSGENFFWASASKQEFRTNVCMYSLPVRNMTLDDFVAARDSVMMINIPGDREGQWMETDSRTVSYKSRTMRESGQNVIEVRGLWDMRNDAMGGPFVSYVMTDDVNNRLIVAEGFIFAPKEEKRAMIRQLEATLQTVILTQNSDNTQK